MKANHGDSDDLEALFDSIVESKSAAAASPQPKPARVATAARTHDGEDCPADRVLSRIGQMTRGLHESLRELGYDKMLEKAASAIPDTRERLAYVANMTAQAADRVLNATDTARPIQEALGQEAAGLSRNWDRLMAHDMDVDGFRQLVASTREYLRQVPRQTAATNAQLHDIMMAQDFQDLTGQVIKRITEMVQNVEQQMVLLLVENADPEKRSEAEANGLLNGPHTGPAGSADVAHGQNQVDELLESLGF